MAKKLEAVPTKPEPGVITLAMEIELQPRQVAYLASMVPGDNTETDIRKAQSIILRLVEDQADGGLMLKAGEVKLIRDSTGVDPSCGADLLPFVQATTGRADGCLTINTKVDPAFEAGLQEIATMRGVEIAELIRDTVQYGWFNNWYETLPQLPRQVLMTEADQAGLEELLGGKFSTGTELAALVRRFTGAEGGLFNELPKIMANEVTM